ncbi:Regulatory-associated protein of TOR 1 [Zea mays]|uniref:Regulatory-associated protein of TOR 1 n=1 Tax=Zea mays TaxID=4577 RepID=A0A1D6QGG0_MAIZE|nr:Regulatory-associated protein of TOR 1 [Zea mays]AQK56962.1 Regulatory-associated protein of TOR 1 [Zea mays]AQK56969.1 Regulatory-associated protein of TOR 1 [Zea mays]
MSAGNLRLDTSFSWIQQWKMLRIFVILAANMLDQRVLFHYNGHGVPKPTSNGEIWVFNKSYTQYIPLPITDLDSWLKAPSIYVFDCSAAGIIVKAFLERLDWSSTSSASSQKDCILLAACEAHQTLPQSAEFPADVFTACLTTPIKMALHWFCKRTLLCGSLDHSLIDKIPGRQNDRKTILGELNWIFTAITDTIAWNVLPRDVFQRLFRQDLLVASLFRNFLLAERIMRSANCSPVSYPLLPPTHQHHMWDAWDMAAEICLSKLPQLIDDPNAEFQPSPFFTEQLTAFEVWLDHGSEDKKPPEQLPIVLQVLLSQSHRFRALVLLGRFLDMGPWAVDLALSVGIFPYVLKLLPTNTIELRQILVFIWTKILSLDKSCQVDLVKDGGHTYFIRFLDSLDAFPEQRAMAAFVIAVIVDGHRMGQEACMNAGLIDVCLRHLQPENLHAQTEPLLLQWLCLCLGKLWEDFPEAQLLGLQTNAPETVICLLSEPRPEVRAAAVFALGNLTTLSNCPDDDSDDDEKVKAEINVVRSLLQISSDGSPLVRSEVAIALTHFALGHNKNLKSVAAEYWKPQSKSLLKSLPSLANINNPSNVYSPNNILQGSIGPVLRVGSDSGAAGRDGHISTSSPIAASSIMHGSPQSDDSSQHSDSGILLRENASNGGLSYTRSRPVDNVIYSQFISTMCSVSKDPDPRIATIGWRALTLIGVEQVAMKSTRFNSGGLHRGETSASTFGMAHSSSWRDMNSGSNSMKFMTPPVSPPQHDYLLLGLRRVCSMEFGQHPINSPDGFANLLLSSATGPSNAELKKLPESTIYNWSCGHFSRPLLTASDDNEETNARREERERIALDFITKCQRSSACKITSQIASWDTRFELGTKAALLLPFSPIVVAADENEKISVWNYDDAQPVNSFHNHKLSDRGLSKLLLINELDECLLLAASSDGNVRIWKNFACKGGQKLVTAFSSVQGHRAAGRSIVIDWQQQSCYLYASGDMSSILVWDLDKEQLLNTIPSSADSAISALSASQVRSGYFAAGFADGSVRIYDVCSPDRPVYVARPHAPRTEKVVGIGFQPGFDPYEIVSASQAGDIQFLDVRMAAEPYLTIEAHRGSLTALAVHRHAPVVASSAKQMIKVFSLEGEQLRIIRYLPSFMGQRTGSVNCLSFHPYKSLLAAGAGHNALVSIYAEENYK